MPQWEYKICEVTRKGGQRWYWAIEYADGEAKGLRKIEQSLNRLGGAGWELISVIPVSYIDGATNGWNMFLKRQRV